MAVTTRTTIAYAGSAPAEPACGMYASGPSAHVT